MNLLVAPFLNALFGINLLLGSLGWTVVVVTVLIRILLLPIVLPSIKSAKKMRELQPRLKELQKKHEGNKQALAEAQMSLYKEKGINPLSGCLPNILQIGVLLLFFSAFNMVTALLAGNGDMEKINSHLLAPLRIDQEFRFEKNFLGSDLTETPAKIFKGGLETGLVLPMVLLLGSGILQYLTSKLMMPAEKGVDQSAFAKATVDKEDDMMAAMRTQSMYMMPLMTIFIGWNFSLGMLLYWFINSAVMLGQQVVAERLEK